MVRKKGLGKIITALRSLQPLQESRLPWGTAGHAPDEMQCICGSTWDIRSGGFHVSTFFGIELVDECCGSILDELYTGFGEHFARKFLEEFAANPSDPRFGLFLIFLSDIIPKAEQKLLQKLQEISPIAAAAVAMQSEP